MCVCYVQQFLGTIGVIVCAVAAGIIEVSLGALDRHTAARGKNYSVSKGPADPQSMWTRRMSTFFGFDVDMNLNFKVDSNLDLNF